MALFHHCRGDMCGANNVIVWHRQCVDHCFDVGFHFFDKKEVGVNHQKPEGDFYLDVNSHISK